MEGRDGDAFMDFFSQPEELPPTGGLEGFSQLPSSFVDGGGRALYSEPAHILWGSSSMGAPRTGIAALDLNSQADSDFANISSLQELLQGDHGVHGRGGQSHAAPAVRVRANRAPQGSTTPYRTPRTDSEGRDKSGRGGGRVGARRARSLTAAAASAKAWVSSGGHVRAGSPAAADTPNGIHPARGSRRDDSHPPGDEVNFTEEEEDADDLEDIDHLPNETGSSS
ncbi:hypothetical protein ACP4OV_007362 [Aristida adscensionis]